MNPYRKYLLILPLLYFILLNYFYYLLPMPLKAYNDHYPFLTEIFLNRFFIIYPFLNVLALVFYLFNKKLCKVYCLCLLIIYTLYLAKLLIYLDCATCSANGFIPFLTINIQVAINVVVISLTLLSHQDARLVPQK